MLFYGTYNHQIVGMLFWYKVITLIIIFFTTTYYKSKELYYYQNLGISKLKLGITTSGFDFIIWLILTIIAY
jgi:hypothetical protein